MNGTWDLTLSGGRLSDVYLPTTSSLDDYVVE